MNWRSQFFRIELNIYINRDQSLKFNQPVSLWYCLFHFPSKIIKTPFINYFAWELFALMHPLIVTFNLDSMLFLRCWRWLSWTAALSASLLALKLTLVVPWYMLLLLWGKLELELFILTVLTLELDTDLIQENIFLKIIWQKYLNTNLLAVGIAVIFWLLLLLLLLGLPGDEEWAGGGSWWPDRGGWAPGPGGGGGAISGGAPAAPGLTRSMYDITASFWTVLNSEADLILEEELEYWDNLDEDDEAGADDKDDGPEVSEDDSFCSLYPPTSCLAILCCSLNCLKYFY